MKITPRKEISDLLRGLFKEDYDLESLFDCSARASGLILRFGSLAYAGLIAVQSMYYLGPEYSELLTPDSKVINLKQFLNQEALLGISYLSGCLVSYAVNKNPKPITYQIIRYGFNCFETMIRNFAGKCCSRSKIGKKYDTVLGKLFPDIYDIENGPRKK